MISPVTPLFVSPLAFVLLQKVDQLQLRRRYSFIVRSSNRSGANRIVYCAGRVCRRWGKWHKWFSSVCENSHLCFMVHENIQGMWIAGIQETALWRTNRTESFQMIYPLYDDDAWCLTGQQRRCTSRSPNSILGVIAHRFRPTAATVRWHSCPVCSKKLRNLCCY